MVSVTSFLAAFHLLFRRLCHRPSCGTVIIASFGNASAVASTFTATLHPKSGLHFSNVNELQQNFGGRGGPQTSPPPLSSPHPHPLFVAAKNVQLASLHLYFCTSSQWLSQLIPCFLFLTNIGVGKFSSLLNLLLPVFLLFAHRALSSPFFMFYLQLYDYFRWRENCFARHLSALRNTEAGIVFSSFIFTAVKKLIGDKKIVNFQPHPAIMSSCE